MGGGQWGDSAVQAEYTHTYTHSIQREERRGKERGEERRGEEMREREGGIFWGRGCVGGAVQSNIPATW